jgi:hypothetical protein
MMQIETARPAIAWFIAPAVRSVVGAAHERWCRTIRNAAHSNGSIKVASPLRRDR